MNYQKIIKIIAKTHGTTPFEVDKEIRFAINSAGLQTTPAEFIKAVCLIEKLKTAK